jgi:hypothetical protein
MPVSKLLTIIAFAAFASSSALAAEPTIEPGPANEKCKSTTAPDKRCPPVWWRNEATGSVSTPVVIGGALALALVLGGGSSGNSGGGYGFGPGGSAGTTGTTGTR